MKLPKFNFFKKKKTEALPSRITNETVAEHRERILAGGRRFKYPVQYGRMRLVITTVVISLVAVVLFVIFGWWQLYVVQNSNNFFYQTSRVLALPVAQVDGHPVRYSDYLMQYRGSIYFSENIEGLDLDNENGEQMKSYYKRQALNNAVAEGYAEKLAKDLDITVSDEEVEKLLESHMSADGQQVSRQAYAAAVNEMYGWSEDEYLRMLERQLLRQKVSVAIDDEARELKDKIEEELEAGDSNFEEIAEKYDGQVELAAPGMVPHSNNDGGQAEAALQLEPGEVSSSFVSRGVDGYYFVRLVSKTDKEVSYQSIKVPLTELSRRLQAMHDNDKVNEYIDIPEVATQVNEEEE